MTFEDTVILGLSVVVLTFVVDTFGFRFVALVALVAYKAGFRVVVRVVVVLLVAVAAVVFAVARVVIEEFCDFVLNCVIGEIVDTFLVVYGTFVVVKFFLFAMVLVFVVAKEAKGFCVTVVLIVVVGFRVVVVR